MRERSPPFQLRHPHRRTVVGHHRRRLGRDDAAAPGRVLTARPSPPARVGASPSARRPPPFARPSRPSIGFARSAAAGRRRVQGRNPARGPSPLQRGWTECVPLPNTKVVRAVLGLDESSRAATHRHTLGTGVGSRPLRSPSGGRRRLPTPVRRTPTPRRGGVLLPCPACAAPRSPTAQPGNRFLVFFLVFFLETAGPWRERNVLVHLGCSVPPAGAVASSRSPRRSSRTAKK
jgi:hypothetical protein